MTLPLFEAVLFDMDGTLINTEILYMEEWRRAAATQGFELSEALWHRFLGRPTHECLQELKSDLGDGFSIEDHVAEWRPRLADRLSREIPVMPGARELLAYLATTDIHVTVVTSASRKSAETYLATAGLRKHFGTIVTWDDVTQGKPHPEPFLAGASLLGIEPQKCLAIEDTVAGIRSAFAAGTHPIMVPSLKQPDPDVAQMCRLKCDDLIGVRKHIETALSQRQ
jgi:HAD superfamily hydrolase (TIGR01509 family)